MVTQPVSRSAATSPLPATSSSVTNPWVRLPTEQLPWSAFTVEKVDSVAWFQNTQPAGTRPVRPSSREAGIGRSNASTPAGGASENVIAIGAVARFSAADRRPDRSFQVVGISALGGRGAVGCVVSGAEATKSPDDLGEYGEQPVDVGVGGRPAGAHPQRVVGVGTHRREHGRGFERLRRACRARVHRDPLLVERKQDRLGLLAGRREVRLGLEAGDVGAGEVGKSVRGFALELAAGPPAESGETPLLA